MNIPPWLSLGQQLRDAALKVEILRDEKTRSEQTAEGNGHCCDKVNHELMRAEILYRESLLTHEAEIRKTLRELKDTRIPLTRPQRIGHPVVVMHGLRDLKPYGEAPVEGVVKAVKTVWQQTADQFGETVLVLPHRCPKLCAEGPSAAYCVAESEANDWEQKNFVERVEPAGTHRGDTDRLSDSPDA